MKYPEFRITQQPSRKTDGLFWFLIDKNQDSTPGKISSQDLLAWINANVDINPIDYIDFNTTAVVTNAEGRLYWNATDGTLNLGMYGGLITLQIGQETFVKIVNKTGATILNGKAVYINGSQGNRPTVALAKGDSETTGCVLGIATHDILNNQEGFITINGSVRSLDTSVFAEGDTLWLSKTTAGAWQNTEPTIPHHSDRIGIVTNSHGTQGSINVQIARHMRISELSDVNGTPLTTTGQIMVWDQTNQYFDFNYNINDYLLKDWWTRTQRYGFMGTPETSIAFDDTTYTFTLTSLGATWSYFRGGELYTISGSKTVTIPGTPPTAGRYFIYIDSTDGTLIVSTSAWTLLDTKVPVALIYWNNALAPKYHMADERHTCLIDRRMHWREHVTEGTRFVSGGALSGYTVTPVSPVDTDNTFGIDGSVISDEDIVHSLAALSDPPGDTYAYITFYRSSGSFLWVQTQVPYDYGAGSYIKWDNAGTMTDGTASNYYNTYLLYTHLNGEGRYLIVHGRDEFSSLVLAQAESPLTFDWTGFNVAESVIGWQFTWATNASYGTKGKCRLAAAPKQINISATSSVASASVAHNLTSGLQGGNIALDQFYHLTSAEYTGTGTDVFVRKTNPTFTNSITLNTLAHETTDVDKFLVSNAGLVKYRTGAEMLTDIGAVSPAITLTLTQGAGITVTNSGSPLDLSVNRSWTITSTITQYTDALARASISLTTVGSSGAATYTAATGVFNIPNYTFTHAAKAWVDKTDLSGAYVISNLTIDASGHPTNWTTRQLTYADLLNPTHTLESHSATTSAGKILYGTGVNTFGWLAMGSASQVLRVNAGGSTLEYVTPPWLTTVTAHNLLSDRHSDVVVSTALLGDLLVANASNLWTRLPGTASTIKKYLTQTGNGTISALPVWETVNFVSATLTSAYIIVGNSSNVATAVQMTGNISITSTGVTSIADEAVTFARMQHINSNTLLGRASALAGDVEALTTIPSAILGNSTVYIGTTAVALNRASSPLALTGISSLAVTTIYLYGSISGIATITAPNSFTNYSLILPADDGTSGQFLQTNGTGTLSWATVTSGVSSFNTRTGAVTLLKTDVEGVLTGDITSHTHSAYVPTSRTLTINGTAYDLSANRSWTIATGSGTVTQVNTGNGMNFTSFTTTGTITLGTPSTCTAATTNSVTTTSHTHAITGFSVVGHTHTEYAPLAAIAYHTRGINISGSVAGDTLLYLSGAAGQTGNYFQIYNGSSANYMYVTAAGYFGLRTGTSINKIAQYGNVIRNSDEEVPTSKAVFYDPIFYTTASAPTPSAYNDSTYIATTEWVNDALERPYNTSVTNLSLTADNVFGLTPLDKTVHTYYNMDTTTTFNASNSASNGEGHTYILRIKDNGTTKTINFGGTFVKFNKGAEVFPTSTTGGKWMYFVCRYNAQSATWDIMDWSIQQ